MRHGWWMGTDLEPLRLCRAVDVCDEFLLCALHLLLLNLNHPATLHNLNLNLLRSDVLLALGSLQLVRQVGLCARLVHLLVILGLGCLGGGARGQEVERERDGAWKRDTRGRKNAKKRVSRMGCADNAAPVTPPSLRLSLRLQHLQRLGPLMSRKRGGHWQWPSWRRWLSPDGRGLPLPPAATR